MVHPVWWAVGSGAVLVVSGIAIDLVPVVIALAGAAIALLNILHAKKLGYCPRPTEPGSSEASEDRTRRLHRLDQRSDAEVGR